MSEVVKKAKLAQTASRFLNRLSLAEKNKILLAIAAGLLKDQDKILAANLLDLKAGQKNKMSESLQDRLRLDYKRIKQIADSVREVVGLPDPNGRVLAEIVRPNGLRISKVAVPMGVIGIIYESRPNVTVDAAVLCLKAGSAVILRGSSDALNSNKAIVRILRAAIASVGCTPEIVQLIESPNRALVGEMLGLNKYIDLLIPRGGAGLIQRVVQEATVPVLETGVGNCHVYVDQAADIKKALQIAYNAKVQRPSVCNSIESLLVHSAIADKFLPQITAQYKLAGVVMHGCKRTRKYDKSIKLATNVDYAREYLGLEIAIKVVDSVEEAIEHILQYGSKHTEAIITENKAAADKFVQDIDAAAVMVNASTRFTDGGEFGFGCELGISTQKLHARGPMGLAEIMTYKYIVLGNGQIRQ